MDNRLMRFEFNENQLIGMLSEFYVWATGEAATEEDRGQIASYVMEGNLNMYEVTK